MTSFAAIDLGATSGRVITGAVVDGELRLAEAARFENVPVLLPDGLHWDALALYSAAMRGLGRASQEDSELRGAAIDSWAVDYGLLAGDRLLSNPFSYRDARNDAGVAAVHATVGPEELWRRNGLQHLPFNTVFQLAVDSLSGALDAADRVLLLPDLLGRFATGTAVAERTNASTTGLLPVGGGGWDGGLLDRLGIARALLPELVDAGTDLGEVRPEVRDAFGLADGVRLGTVGSHDTASAVVATPLGGAGAVYISSGTWSLVGAELPEPVLSEEARRAGFTNEGGVDGRTRFLTNVTGLWLLTETVRGWEHEDRARLELGALLRQAAEVTGDVPVFDAGDPRLLAPGDMPRRIAAVIAESGGTPPMSRPAFVRTIVQSLADAYARAVRDLERLTGIAATTVHVVGGGTRNTLLCQLTADATGLPVLAGPEEATAAGNLLVQARAAGVVPGDLETLRAVVARSFPTRAYSARTPSRARG